MLVETSFLSDSEILIMHSESSGFALSFDKIDESHNYSCILQVVDVCR